MAERMGLVVITLLLVSQGFLSFAFFGARFDDGGPLPPAFAWLLSFMPAAGYLDEFTPLVLLAGFLYAGYLIFFWSAREPLLVARAIGWFTVLVTLYVVLRSPPYLDLGRLVAAAVEHPFDNASVELVYVALVCLSLIILYGEFGQVALDRVMFGELIQAELESEKASARVRRRHQLIVAVSGPRMPVLIALGRMLSMIAVPPLLWYNVIALAWSRYEKELPGPRIVAAASNNFPRDASRVRIDDDGRVYLLAQLIGTPSDRTLLKLRDALHATKLTRADNRLVLKVGDDVQYERLIDVVNAVTACRMRVVIED